MKKIKMLKNPGLLLSALMLMFSCSDFEDININPTAANVDQVQVEYFINASIGQAQQDPHISERVFHLYWNDAGRTSVLGTLSEGFVSDGWSNDYYNRYVSRWIRDATNAITLADEKMASGNIKEFTENLKQIARIWRAYTMSEMADNFGPIPINAF